ncbi:MAG: protease SohB [Bdellovibrionota bacterium]
MEILEQLGLFFGQTLIIVLAIIAVILTLATAAVKNKMGKAFEVEIINDKIDDQKEALNSIIMSDADFKKEKKRLKKEAKEEDKNPKKYSYLIDFLKGDVEASSVDHLKEEINAVLTVAQKNDEVILRIESPGGVVHGYGLAAAQILRLREAGLQVTVCVDKVAASGGYLMSCVAHKIIASPFAIIGSIGVVAQVPNFNRLLKKHDVEYKEYTAGDYKRTVSIFGEITEKGEAKFREQLEVTHLLFKGFVGRYRPQLNMERVATGEYWYGETALELNLVDKIQTSDDYILNKTKTHKVLKVSCEKKPTLSDKISGALSKSVSLTIDKLVSQLATKKQNLELGNN